MKRSPQHYCLHDEPNTSHVFSKKPDKVVEVPTTISFEHNHITKAAPPPRVPNDGPKASSNDNHTSIERTHEIGGHS
ncbi:hypothetical protein AALP_AA4G133200 [Arabis alpina]|uniref:Uncharacterized protein n=1 Tax=Arabis alpina TaxID=50452 RepID=A0A087H305_ARAAL|nr:hypothetical protein AALP_AA4G133200 [Arabis alpina]